MGVEYPKRDPFFAHKFIRLMHKAAIAAEIGRDAFSLLTVIAHTEDAMRYRGPAKFWNSQLIETLGFTKWDQFDKARRRAIDAGWLQYFGDGKRTAGEYFVTIPVGYEQISDSPIEETCTTVKPENGYERGYKDGYKQGIIEGIKRGRSGVQTGDEQGEPSNPSPIPKPKERGSLNFRPPSVADVASYCGERSYSVDAEMFVDFYQSKNWMVGKSKMKDWQAAVRTWARKNIPPKKKERLPDTSTPEGMAEIRRLFLQGMNEP
jgi:hypothetical protein